MASYGFDGYALDNIEGPEQVLNMLCHETGIHRTVGISQLISLVSQSLLIEPCLIGYKPISRKDFTPSQNKKMEDTSISSWIAGRTSYRIIRRREYNASSTRLGTIRPATLFKTQQVDQSLKTEIGRKISELRDGLAGVEEEKATKEREHHEIKTAHGALQEEVKSIEAEKTAKQQEVAKFNRLKATLGPMEEDLKQKSVGGEEYKERARLLSNKLVELAVKKAKDALEYGVITSFSF